MTHPSTARLPAAMGPYATTVRAGGFLYLSGQGGLDPETGEPGEIGIAAETRQTLENMSRLLQADGYDLRDLVQVTCYLTDLSEWARMNDAYAEFFPEGPRPTRTAVGVRELPFGLTLEMTAVAYRADRA